MLAAAIGFGLTACQSVPPVDAETTQAIGDATGFGSAVQFRIVGPDGGSLDEPAIDAGTFTASDALRRTISTDPGLQAALARVRIALADADQARRLPNPILDIALRLGPGKPQIEAGLAQDLIALLQRGRRSSAADHRLRQAAADAITVAIDIAAETQERYVAAQAAAAQVPLLRQRIDLLSRLEIVAQDRLDAGEGTRTDLTTLQAQRLELQSDIDRAARSEREERLRLARLIGEPSSAAAWTLDAWSEPPLDSSNEAAWIETALRKRPEIQSIGWRLKALGDDEALLRLLPWEGASAGVAIERDDSEWSAGPAISTPVPIFDSGGARRARLTAEQLEARHDLTRTRRQVVEEVRVAHAALTASLAHLRRYRDELIPTQEHRSRLAGETFREGHADVTALILAEQDLRLAQLQAIDLEHQAALALIRLQRAVGGPGVSPQAPAATPSLPETNS